MRTKSPTMPYSALEGTAGQPFVLEPPSVSAWSADRTNFSQSSNVSGIRTSGCGPKSSVAVGREVMAAPPILPPRHGGWNPARCETDARIRLRLVHHPEIEPIFRRSVLQCAPTSGCGHRLHHEPRGARDSATPFPLVSGRLGGL